MISNEFNKPRSVCVAISFAYKDNIICERFANNAEEKARKKARMQDY